MISGNFVDSLVLRALRDDDEKALEHLFQSYYNRLFRMSLKLHPDSELAKECIQEVFNDLWNYRKTLAEIDSFEAYLKTALKRRIFKELTRLRKKKAKDEASFSEQEIEVPSWEEVIIEQQAQNVDQEKIRSLIDQLSPRQKEIVVLKYFEEMSYAQIADRTGLQTDTIYKILHEAIKRMKSLVGLST
jgi:RNA polymerase sigma factor (sigma-70 family)